jgi:hypothetical protein
MPGLGSDPEVTHVLRNGGQADSQRTSLASFRGAASEVHRPIEVVGEGDGFVPASWPSSTGGSSASRTKGSLRLASSIRQP